MHGGLFPKVMYLGSRDLFKFVGISGKLEDRHSNRKSYVAYRMHHYG